MKRALKIVGLVLLVLIAIPVGLLAVTFMGNPEIPDGRELEGFARVVKDGYVSVDVLDAGDGAVALIDAGNDPDGKAILAELQRRHLGPEAVKVIFLTHGHVDHVGACHLFPKAEVMALAADVPIAEARARSNGPLPRLLPPPDRHVRVTHALQDGEMVRVGNLSVRVFSIPGHTAGSAAYLVNGVLFLGDSADATKDGRVALAKWIFSDDLEQNRASLAALVGRLKPDEVKHLVFAHTGVLDGSAPLRALASK